MNLLRRTKKMSRSATAEMLRSFYEGAKKGQNVGAQAVMINMTSDEDLIKEVFEVRGFKEFLASALPPEQHKLGYLAKF